MLSGLSGNTTTRRAQSGPFIIIATCLTIKTFKDEIKESNGVQLNQELKKEKGVEPFNYLFDIVSTLVYIFE
ncbi:hypothetical protein CMV_019451 [Castanea mollissima]|uniref:Uncharacterized protein n=1 Tax=Castanea mollissima TaxID=60419 RepID=A0A8J4QJS0_9ROSI|nr:hypothetical protein CMV_019451 [Castanea mollissima]